jgi:hypothetical protein
MTRPWRRLGRTVAAVATCCSCCRNHWTRSTSRKRSRSAASWPPCCSAASPCTATWPCRPMSTSWAAGSACTPPAPTCRGPFVVIDDSGYNAFAAPGGYVFVTKGLIDRSARRSGAGRHPGARDHPRHQPAPPRGPARQGAGGRIDPAGGIAAAQQPRWLGVGADAFAGAQSVQQRPGTSRMSSMPIATASNSPPAPASTPLAWPPRCNSCVPPCRTIPLFTLSLSTHPPPQQRLDRIELAMGNRLDGFRRKTPGAADATPGALSARTHEDASDHQHGAGDDPAVQRFAEDQHSHQDGGHRADHAGLCRQRRARCARSPSSPATRAVRCRPMAFSK